MERRLTLAGRVGLEVDRVGVSSNSLGRPGRLALAYLASERHRPVPRDELAEVIWGEELPASWVQMLRGIAFKIRSTLTAAGLDGATSLVTASGTYQLRLPEHVGIDVEEATAALTGARDALDAGDLGGAVSAAVQAAEIAARQFAPDATGVWAERRQAELREVHLCALEVRARCALAQADWPAAVLIAEEAVAAEPYRETAYQLLMGAHAGAGNLGEALRAYDRCRTVLAEQLGVSPSPATEAAYVRLLGDAAGTTASLEPQPLALPSALAAIPGAFVVGRDAERGSLAEAFKRATVDGRQAVFVGGEPGVGKTTLVAQAARLVHAEGARVLYGRCDEDLGVPYQAFVQALTHYVLNAPLDELTGHVAEHGGELVRLVPALGRRLPGTPQPSSVDADADRWRLFEAVVGLLRTAAAIAPVVLVLDDLQWAAPATLLLMRHVLRATTDERLVVLGAFRDSEVGAGHPLADVLADLRGVAGVERLALRGLDEAGVEAFVDATRESDGDTALALARAVWIHTAGNPFFVGELLRHLGEARATFPRACAWRDDAGDGALDVPASVVDVVRRRIGRLTAQVGRTLTLAAVVGVEFDIDVLERAAGPTDDDIVLDAVEQAVAASLVVESNCAGSYRFMHALVRTALYGQLGGTRRARLHRQVGEALEARPGDDGIRLPALAYHFAEGAAAGVADKAADYGLLAAEHAFHVPATEAAVAVLRRAAQVLEVAGPQETERRVAVLVALARALFRDGQGGDGRDVALRAFEAARIAGMAREMADAAYLQALPAAGQGGREQPVKDALEALGDGSSSLRARLLAVLATLRVPLDDVSDRLSAQAVDLARTDGDPRAVHQVLHHRWTVLLSTPDSVELLAVAEELVATEATDKAVACGRVQRLISRLVNGDRAGFDADVEELERIGEATHAWGARSSAARWQVVQAEMDGRFDEVPALAARADEIFAEKRKPRPVTLLTSMLLWDRGRFEELHERSIRGSTTDEGFELQHRGWLAVAKAGVGDIDGSQADLIALTNGIGAISRVEWFSVAAKLAEVAAVLHDRDRAATLYDRFLPYAGQIVTGLYAFCFGSVDRHLGMLATLLERWGEADAHFHAALAVDAGLSAPPLVARTQYWYARFLARAPGADRRRASEMLAQAGATANRLEMTALAAQVDELRGTL